MPSFSSVAVSLIASAFLSLAPPCLADDADDFHLMKNEAIGELKFDMPATQVGRLIADSPKMGPKKLWEADGLLHQTWRYAGLGLDVEMTAENKKAAQHIGGITIKRPSVLQTRRGIHIGSPEADVLKAYKGDISKEDSKAGQIVVAGSLYGGLVFTIERGQVTTIFLGAAAE